MKSSLPPSAPLEPGSWSPPVSRSWPQRLLRGWGLVGTILAVLILYVMLRGRTDYRNFKAYLSHRDAAQAMELSAQGKEQEAIALLEKAGARSPNDALVLRALADFNEPRQDPMTLYALRKLVNNGDADTSDRERLCRLAFDWGHAELADSETLRDWALSDPAKLALRPLELSARWMASRGQGAAAEIRLRQALKQANGDAATPAIEVVLARLILSSPIASAEMAGQMLGDATTLLRSSLSATAPPAPIHGEAAKILASIILRPDWVRHISPETIELTRKELLAQSAAVQKIAPVAALEFRLTELSLRLVLEPAEKLRLVEGIIQETVSADLKERAALARWLIEHEMADQTLIICDGVPESLASREWFTTRLDALYALKRWQDVKQLLAVTNPLPELVQALFLLTVDKSMEADTEALVARRKKMTELIPRTEFKEILYVAGVLERTGELALAMTLYDSLQNHSQAGLPARLGLVRCLSQQLEKTPELIEALNSLLVLWPHSDEARSDLAYLRLLDKTHRQEDVQSVLTLAQTNPWYLAYRIPAAIALLRINEPQKAIMLLDQPGVPWDRARAGWISVYAATLAANQRLDEARKWAAQLSPKDLRPGERKLLAEYLLETKP